jgi:hypothetical protein
MIIQYWRPDPKFPELEVRGPSVSAQDKLDATLRPPPALPQHCKPWLAAQSLQVLVRYPYEVSFAVTGTPKGYPCGTFLDSVGQPLREFELISLSTSYFTINTEYRVVTPAGFGIYVTATPDAPAAAIPGLIESWWYPKSLFVVFRTPAEGERVVFHHADPLCVLLPVPCDKLQVTELDAAGHAALREREQDYDDYRSHRTDLQWTSAIGRTFSHAYRSFQRSERAQQSIECRR